MTSPMDITGTGAYSPKLEQASIVRKQVSQGGSGYIGLEIRGDDGLVDPTNITLRVFRKDDFETYNQTNALGEQIAEPDETLILKESVGRYYFELGPDLTASRGNLTAIWMYQVDGKPFSYTDHLTVIEPMPEYEALRDYEKAVVQQVSWMFGDLFDSTEGGSNLTENFQTHFTYNRIAQLLHISVNRMNFTGAMMGNWSVGEGNGNQVPEYMQGLMVIGLYLEVLKHFMRSYVEQPDFKNMNVTYTDRRDYLNRWKTIYDDEKADYLKMLALAKRKQIGLAGGALLVSGGVYGSGAGLFQYGMYAAQVRSMRFLPAASAMTFVNAVNGGSGSGPWGGSR